MFKCCGGKEDSEVVETDFLSPERLDSVRRGASGPVISSQVTNDSAGEALVVTEILIRMSFPFFTSHHSPSKSTALNSCGQSYYLDRC